MLLSFSFTYINLYMAHEGIQHVIIYALTFEPLKIPEFFFK